MAAVDSGSNPNDTDISSVVQQILGRLLETRKQIGDAVGLPMATITQAYIREDPQRALLQELGVWNKFEERV